MSLKEKKKTDSIYSNNNSNYFITSSKKRYKHIDFPNEITNHKNSDIKKISILLLCVYYYQVCSLEETYRIFNHYNLSNKEVNMFLFNDDKASHKNKTNSQYIIIVKERSSCNGLLLFFSLGKGENLRMNWIESLFKIAGEVFRMIGEAIDENKNE